MNLMEQHGADDGGAEYHDDTQRPNDENDAPPAKPTPP
jgi:hypothetical protein